METRSNRTEIHWNYQLVVDSFSNIPYLRLLSRRTIYTRSLVKTFVSLSLSLSLSLSFSLSRKKDRRSSRQMPVSAPIKFFDASPISFSNEIFVFSPLPLPFPCFEKGPHGNLYRSPGSCALKSRKESANRRGGGEGTATETGISRYLHLGRRFYSRLARFRRKQCASSDPCGKRERKRDIAKERERERERVKGKREKIVEQSRGLTPFVLFSLERGERGIHTRFFFSFRGWTTPLCGGKWGEGGCEMDVCRWGIRDDFSFCVIWNWILYLCIYML